MQSSWKQAADHDVSPALRAPWRVALLSDGSIMRHLHFMTDGLVDKVTPYFHIELWPRSCG